MGEAWSTAASEARRRAILASYPLDRPDIARQLDRLASLAAKICETPVGLVGVVEADRLRFVGRSGLDVVKVPREHTFCDLAMHSPNGLIVGDVSADERFRDSPLVTGEPGIRLYASYPLRSLEGAPLGTLCVVDTEPRQGLSDDQAEALRTLAEAAMGLLERWRLETRSEEQAAISRSTIHDLQQRYQILADAMPQLVWSTLPSGRSDYFNRLWCEYTGAPASASYGDGWIQFLHPDDAENVARVWQEAVSTGRTYDIEYRLRRADGEFRWMLVRGLPIRDEFGEISRWLGTCTDIHEQKRAAVQQELLTRELSHRIKNIFAVISGLITLSLRRHPELDELGRDLQQRVLALGRAHDFVRPHSERSRSIQPHSSLRGMLDSLLGAYQSAPCERLTIHGQDVRIDDRSATPLALFFHELATNSVKYGALSVGEGRVEIGIETDDDTVALSWTESGGPPVPAVTSPGFGSTLIDMSVKRQLGGTLDYDWRKEGLCVKARIPMQMMAR